MKYYQLKKEKTTGQELWVIQEGLLSDGDVPSTAHEEILPVLFTIQQKSILLTMPAVVEKNVAYINEEALKVAIDKYFEKNGKMHKAMRGIEYAEKPVPAIVKDITIKETKAWVKELGLGKPAQVTLSTKDKWLKKILKKLQEIEGDIKLTKKATVTIEETTGWKAGKKFLPLETSTKKRIININDKTKRNVKIGDDSFKAKDLVNMAARIRHIIDDPSMVKKIEAYKRKMLREGKPLHSGRGQRRVTGRGANRAEQEAGAIAYPVPESTLETEGSFGIVKGMSDPRFVGGFVRPEQNFIETLIFLKNQELEGSGIDFEKSKIKLINKNDLHLFSGHSPYGNTRVDIRKEYPYKMRDFEKEISPGVIGKRPKDERLADPGTGKPRIVMLPTSANKHMLVQDFLKNAIQKGLKFDLIIIDPPYNAKFDAEYGTDQYNNIGENNKFLAWLVGACTQILNPDGILISKNWRNIRPFDSQFVAGIVSFFGGYRRAVIMEAWQYQASKVIEFDWNLFASLYETEVPLIPWYLGLSGKWVQKEIDMMNKYTDINQTKNGVIITDPPGQSKFANVKVGNCVSMSVDDFLIDHKKRDVIILDECKGVGGSTRKTNYLKEHLVGDFDEGNVKDKTIKSIMESELIENEARVAWQATIYNHARKVLAHNGLIFTKTYFDPVLDDKGLQLLERHVICFEKFEKIGMFHLYMKP